MSNSLSLTTPNYTQAEKNFFITDAVIGLDSLNAGLFYLATDVKNDQYTFPKATSTVVLQAPSDLPTSAGATVLSNRTTVLGKFENYAEFNPSIFENHWQQDQISSNLLARGLGQTFENYLTTYYTALSLSPIENMIWMGSTTFTGATNNNRFIDGIVKQSLTPATSALTVTGASVTVGNIIGKLEEMRVKLASVKGLMTDPNRYKKLKFLMSVEDALKYEAALQTTTFKNQNTTERGINQYAGYEIIVLAGLPEHTIFFLHADKTVNSNLHMPLTGTENMNFELAKLQANSPLYFYKLMFKFGVGINKPYEAVMHTTKVLGDFTGA